MELKQFEILEHLPYIDFFKKEKKKKEKKKTRKLAYLFVQKGNKFIVMVIFCL